MLAFEFAELTDATRAQLDALLAKRREPDTSVDERVAAIIADVRSRGDDALVDYTRRFDCESFTTDKLQVPPSAFKRAWQQVDTHAMAAIDEAAANIRAFHERQKRTSWMMHADHGTTLGQLVRPVDAVGLYVPGGAGGTTPLVSSILMNAIPAQVAGVERIALTSPPTADGGLNPYLLATARTLGIHEVYAAGSAWAIAALAYGTSTIAPVDVIAGPGNIYVATAKRMVAGHVGIDMFAGPSEICILADETSDPGHVAADLLSQAEHDPLAACILVTTSPLLAEMVKQELATQLAALPRTDIATKSLAAFGGIIHCHDLDEAVEVVNRIAPEHLELAVRDGWSLLGHIRHAGAIFLGHACAEAVGDYFAGPNHVLPTVGTARFSSALSVDTFTKQTSLIAATDAYTRAHGEKIALLARLEGLEAHARSVESRLLPTVNDSAPARYEED